MLVVDLHCIHDHHFEGWFASADELASQQSRGLLSCPVCGAHEVSRRPSAPHLHVSGARPQVESRESGEAAGAAGGAPSQVVDAKPPSSSEAKQALQAMYMHVVRQIVQNTEDVGRAFADEARRMHHGEEPERPIRGQATPAEKEALRNEGIEVMSLPVPDGLDGPLQ